MLKKDKTKDIIQSRITKLSGEINDNCSFEHNACISARISELKKLLTELS